MIQRSILVVLTVIFAVATASSASADEPFDGPFVGVFGGYGFDFVLEEQPAPYGFGAFQLDGSIAGVQTGWSFQSGPLVAGFVADFAWADMSASRSLNWCTVYVCLPGEQSAESHTLSVNWLASMRGRFGVAAADRVLFYGTAGAAFAGLTEVQSTRYVGGQFGKGNSDYVYQQTSTTRLFGFGPVFGAGVSVAVGDRLSLGAEYLRTVINLPSVFLEYQSNTVEYHDRLVGNVVTLTATLHF